MLSIIELFIVDLELDKTRMKENHAVFTKQQAFENSFKSWTHCMAELSGLGVVYLPLSRVFRVFLKVELL